MDLEPKKREKLHCLQGANPVLPQGKSLLGGTLAKFFQRIFGVVPDFSRNKTFMSRTLQLPFFLIIFFWVRLARGVQIFEPVGKKLLGRHALGGDFGGLSLDFGFWILNQRKEKNYIAYRGLILFYHRGKAS